MIDLVVDEIRARGYSVLCVCAHELVSDPDTAPNDAACNSLYALVDHFPVKGIIVLAGAMAQNTSHAKLAKFLSQFSLPLVSIGGGAKGAPIVTTDDVAGMRQLMNHLLTEAGVKNPAFIRGIKGERFTQIRENVFRDEMESHGVAINEDCVIEALYETEVAYDRVSELLQNHPKVDALIACNDMMALGAARAASALGKQIPADIVVAGFDDTDDAIKHTPAITSVRQTLDQLAAIAVDVLICQVEKIDETDVHFEVGSELVVRSSTRRFMPMLTDAGIYSSDQFKLVITRELNEILPPENVPCDELIQNLWNALKDNDPAFGAQINSLKSTISEASLQWWSHTTHTIEQACQTFLQSDATQANALAVMFSVAGIRERIWSTRVDNSYSETRRLKDNAKAQRDLSSSTRTQDVLQNLVQWLKAINARSCYFVQYESAGVTPHERAELLLCWKNSTGERVPRLDFASAAVLPEPYRSQESSDFLIQYPVYAGGKVFGYLLIDPTGLNLKGVDAIANSVGHALRNRSLLREVAAQRDALSRTNEKLERLANMDALTGLPNRLHAQTWMKNRFDKAKKSSERLAVLFLDLDGFKAVNDTFGHAAGDQLLCEVSKRLLAVLKKQHAKPSYLARLAGDEFIVVLDLAADEAIPMAVMEAIRQTLSDAFYFDGERATVSVSVGASIFPDHGEDSERVLRLADAAMYQAKDSGKNKILVHTDELDSRGVDDAPFTGDKAA